MGGKSYFCDYCQCFLKNDINVRKVHNAGLTHNIVKANYMRRYEDPRAILQEELAKVPCIHYLRGRCKFDYYCQYSHYNAEEINEFKEIVRKMDKAESPKSKEEKELKKQRSFRARLKRMKLKNLPPSLRSSEKLKTTNFLPSEWG